MKKLLLSASMLLTAGFAFAQMGNSTAPVKEGNVELRVKSIPVVVNTANVNSTSTKAKKAAVQDWKKKKEKMNELVNDREIESYCLCVRKKDKKSVFV